MKHWWEDYPWRMVQTNLSEIDMEDMDAEAFAKSLSDFGATVVNLNAAGILANYDTAHPFHKRNPHLHGDSLLSVVEACHAKGIRVNARTDFSRVAYDLYLEHPDWAVRTEEGGLINYNGFVSVCINSPYQQKHMFGILRELFAAHPFDGLFCNMSGFRSYDYSGRQYGPCHCENCRRRFREFYGKELPDNAALKGEYRNLYEDFKQRCVSEHTAALVKAVKEISPEIAISGVDYVRSETNTEYGRTNWVYDAALNSRLGVNASVSGISDNSSTAFIGYRHRHISVSPALLELRQWQNLANSGNLSLYIMGRLEKLRDRSCLLPTQKVYRFHKEHEELFRGLRRKAEVLLVSSGNWKARSPETRGFVKLLEGLHIPYDCVQLLHLGEELLSDKKLLILGDLPVLTDSQAGLIDRFAEQGGTVFVTGSIACEGGAEGPETGKPVLKCIGIREVKRVREDLFSSMFEIRTGEEERFPSCRERPLIAPGEWLAELIPEEGTQTLLSLVPEHPFGPPELCYYPERREASAGLFVNTFGKGGACTLPWKAGALYEKEGLENTEAFLRDVLFCFCGAGSIAPGLTPMVSVTVSEKPGAEVLQLVNMTGVFGNRYVEPVPVRDLRLVLPDREYRGIRTLCGGKGDARRTGDGLEIRLDSLAAYEAVVIE